MEAKIFMTIKHFLIIVLCLLFPWGTYLNVRYLKGVEFQKRHQPIKYYSIVVETYCYNSSKMSNSMTILFNRKKYFVGISGGVNCADIADGKIKLKLNYMKDTDKVFLENQYVPFSIVYLT